MDFFDELFDYNGNGELDFWESLDRDTANFIAFQSLMPDDNKPKSSCSNSEGCYIATCVYGSYDAEPVVVLRRFRDNVLSKSISGRAFIKAYYAISPKLVQWFGHNPAIRWLWRKPLDVLVSLLS